MGEIRLKRVYEPPEEEDGLRVLVDRLWPRGLNKDKARIDFWFKEIAPSEELRRGFGHDPARFPLFRKRYEQELRENAAAVGRLLELVRGNPVVTLLYGARDRERNQAVVIREFLNTALGSKRKSKSR